MSTKKQCRKCGEPKELIYFSKHSGTADKLDNRCKECVKKAKANAKESSTVVYPIYDFDMSINEWQVGKPIGSILYRIDSKSKACRWEVRVPLGDGKLKSKSFAIKKYSCEEEAKEEAEKWLRNFSDQNDFTRNRIRLIDKNTIEVKLTKNMIMITDIDFLDVCQKHIIVSTKSSRENSEYYAVISINNTMKGFHNYITGFNMVDHINRDPMDNRLINLREVNHKLNNNNRSKVKKETSTNILGVTLRNNNFIAKIKQDNKQYGKSFSVKKYGYEEAKQMAIKHIQYLNKKFNCNNGVNLDDSFYCTNNEDIKQISIKGFDIKEQDIEQVTIDVLNNIIYQIITKISNQPYTDIMANKLSDQVSNLVLNMVVNKITNKTYSKQDNKQIANNVMKEILNKLMDKIPNES